ncbi:hypothetical protein [Chryseobacterium taichungense]|uniref:Uncharacterized protein n=1 Tax=Chryseobacterium taichungense TaxID=295069 RepID=A0A1H8CJ11_9FLAO|nr:hypothetical protein [Chryseobacterium taichungense]SEM94077.1 hypothetical protein SAMN05421856_10955 [Chryseobacterium taichungense]
MNIKKAGTISELKLTDADYDGEEILLLGYYESGDKDPLLYKYTTQNFSTLVDDGGAVIKTTLGSWIAQFNRVVTLRDFGGKSNTDFDNGPIITKVNTYLANNAPATDATRFTFIIPASENYYKTTLGLVVPAMVNCIMDGTLLFTGTKNNVTVVTVGSAGIINEKTKIKINIRSEGPADWTNSTYVGFKIINAQVCTDFEIAQVIGFTEGGWFAGAGVSTLAKGFVHNIVKLGQLANNKIDLVITRIDDGWCNENIFLKGKFQRVSTTNSGLDKYGIVIRSESTPYSHNNNNFIGPSFEYGYNPNPEVGGGDTVPVVIYEGNTNSFTNVRLETGPVPCVIRTLGNSTDNVFETGYSSEFSYSSPKAVQDLGTYPTTIFTTRKNSVRQKSNKYQVYNSGYLPKKIFTKDGTHVYAPDEMFIAVSGSAANSKNSSTGITVTNTNVNISTSRALGVRVDTSKNKRFIINKYVVKDGLPGRIMVRCYDDSGTVLTNDKIYVKGEATTPPVYNSAFGGVYRMGSDVDTYMYVKFDDDVKYADILIGGGSAACELKSFSIEALDFPSSIIDPYNKKGWYASETPTTTIYETGTIVYSTAVANKLSGWVYNGSVWIDFIPSASLSTPGLVKQSAAVSNITLDDAIDLPTALTLVNELKKQFNAKLTADRNSGIQST